MSSVFTRERAAPCAPDGAAHERRRPVGLAADAGVDAEACVGVAMVELSPGQCRWPVNDAPCGETHLFCAARAVTGSTYCAAHAARAVGQGTLSEREAIRFARNQARRETLSTD